jgi:hypothetical protein
VSWVREASSNGTPLRARDGFRTDIVGDEAATCPAPEDGVCVSHSVNPVAMTRARVLRLGGVATSAQASLSRGVTEPGESARSGSEPFVTEPA